ncbi:hypothetical protein Rs2_27072 [Raphanus sativus]|nr:hypothetical protein Rs2_27072 [Raphanus sativus]
METRATTTMAEMNKQIEDLRISQTKQTEELGGEIAELKAMMAKYFANPPPPAQQEGSSGLTAAEKSDEINPPDRNIGDQSATRTAPLNPAATPNPPLPNSLSARLTKIGFPMFDGSELREWIYRCEQFFSIDTERFSELFDDPLSELVSLKQGSDPIDVYLEKFDCAMNRLTLAPGHALSIFLTNMNQHLALHVRQFNVTTVPAAARIAKLHELSLLHTPVKATKTSFNYSQKQNSSPFYKNQNQTTSSAAPTTNTKPIIPNTPHKRLSFDEMQERKRKGLCMFCEEPFTPGHQLKHKRSQILYLEAEQGEVSDDDDEETPAEFELENHDDKTPTISRSYTEQFDSYFEQQPQQIDVTRTANGTTAPARN